MDFIPATTPSLIFFLLIMFGVVFAVVWATPKQTREKTLVFIILWLGLFAGLSLSGLPEEKPMPFLVGFLVLALLGALAFALSLQGAYIARTVSVTALVLFQVFRLPLELVLHSWAIQGTIPFTMTWTGSNWDILSGIIALLMAPLSYIWKPSAWIANVVGLILLLNVIRVAIMSSPLPFAWHVSPPLVLAFHFPYFLIIPVAIGGALAGHVILSRALLHQ